MIRVATCYKLKDGMQDEYKKRHDEIWPEMKALMGECGIKNYTIWNTGNLLFGYLEVDDYERYRKILHGSSVKRKWDKYMEDIIEVEKDTDTGFQKTMDLMFLFEG